MFSYRFTDSNPHSCAPRRPSPWHAWGKALGVTAAALLGGAGAQASVLYDGYRTAGGAGGVDYIQAATLTEMGKTIPLMTQPVGLAVGGGSIYADFGDHTVSRYDAGTGGLTQSTYTGPFFTPGLLAYGAGTLFTGFTTAGNATGIDFLDATSLADKGTSFYIPDVLSGLAFGNNSIYVSYSHHLARYDLSGNLMQSLYTGPFFDPGALTFGGGKLFAAYTSPASGATGIDFLDGGTLAELGQTISTSELANGLAFGDGNLFGSFEHQLDSWGMDGKLLNSVYTGPFFHSGQIAVGPDLAAPGDGTVPEPATGALTLLGVGMLSVTLRRQRRSA
jgi:hypothetical protein